MSTTFGGTDPTNSTGLFEILSANLDPDTFLVTLTISTVPGKSYRIESHHGPSDSNATWTASRDIVATEFVIILTDDFSGPLSTNGKSYRATIDNTIITANEAFIAYPFLSSPTIELEESGFTNELRINYGEGLYSNQIPYAPPAGQKAGFFRISSTNNDPVNATIQIQTDLVGSTWTNVPTP